MNLVHKLRKKSGLTQTDVEKITGIDSSTISLYENGLRMPTVENAKKLGAFYGVNWAVFFDEGVLNSDKGEEDGECDNDRDQSS